MPKSKIIMMLPKAPAICTLCGGWVRSDPMYLSNKWYHRKCYWTQGDKKEEK